MDGAERTCEESWLRQAVLAGDEAAWKTLYQRHFASLFAYVHYRTGRHDQRTEELLQESWLTAVRKIAQFDPQRGSFEQWLRGIADNLARNAVRRRCRETSAVAALAHASAAPEAGICTSGEPRVELAELIALAYSELPTQYQAVLRARYEEELSVLEIAQQWGQTYKSIESLLSRARAAFREAFAQLQGEEP